MVLEPLPHAYQPRIQRPVIAKGVLIVSETTLIESCGTQGEQATVQAASNCIEERVTWFRSKNNIQRRGFGKRPNDSVTGAQTKKKQSEYSHLNHQGQRQKTQASRAN